MIDEAEKLPERGLVALIDRPLDLADEFVEALVVPLAPEVPESLIECLDVVRVEGAAVPVLVDLGMAFYRPVA
jgi:hypothetical protein